MKDWNIKIREFKNYNHKSIYVGKYHMITYNKIPKSIMFKNQMVNDMNQNLCGGWRIFDNCYELDRYIVERVFNKEKPFGTCGYIKGIENKFDYKQLVETIKNSNLPYKFISEPDDHWDRFYICQNGTMGELFNLDCLYNDYLDNQILIDIEKVKHKELKEYFKGWDIEHVEPWETGLILGYPIENTISLYLS